jgi:hypothetical protein
MYKGVVTWGNGDSLYFFIQGQVAQNLNALNVKVE